MENAANALLIASAVLIAILILSALVFAGVKIGEYYSSQEQMQVASEVAKYNNQFLSFERDDLTLMELQSVYNKIISNNKNNTNKIEQNISEILKDKTIEVKVSPGNTILKSYDFTNNSNFSAIPEEAKIKCKFKCEKVEYSKDTGKISKMIFSDQTNI